MDQESCTRWERGTSGMTVRATSELESRARSSRHTNIENAKQVPRDHP